MTLFDLIWRVILLIISRKDNDESQDSKKE